MMLKKLLFFFGLLQAVVGQDRRIYIDTVTCGDPILFNAMEETYNRAIIRAGMAVDALRPWALGGAPINTFDGRIRAVFDLLFGAGNTRLKVDYVFGHLDRLLDLRYMNDQFTGSEWHSGPTKRTMYDIEIRCNGDYIEPHPHSKEPNINHKDSITGKDVTDNDSVLDLKKLFTSTHAVTSPVYPASGRGWDPEAPEVIAWNWYRLWPVVHLNGFPGAGSVFVGVKIDQAAVEAAANARMRGWLLRNAPEWFARKFWTPIDLLDRLDSLMLHELTHTTAGRLAKDIDLPNSYGWRNCLRLQTHQNSAFFALAVELINSYHYDVNQAGELTRIDD
ncbi:hypothetical protein LCI18_014998 [Fusarium solani-melongenae]|uniref:Uncharacterized protein n=1 Tax=Fusarium solani subsp. cucurbitae TaxID=2747967 RepID=A0ACD3ZRV4_FUSSC|nr:hypothetical protein LCI18_014998 [Fusarium solani-melongenae]